MLATLFRVLLTLAALWPASAAVARDKVDKHKPGEQIEVAIGNGVKMKFCWIPPGEAQLGSSKAERDYVAKRYYDGKPPGWLNNEDETKRGKYQSTGFWLARYPVTQEQWEALMGKNPSWFSKAGKGKDKVAGLDTRQFPVEMVSWDDCREFLKKLNASVKVPADMGKGKFVLPSGDEWEYAARGGKGNKQPFYFGNQLDGSQANCWAGKPYGARTQARYKGRTTKVGEYESAAPHPWGLCDMHGNVFQWCDNQRCRGGSWDAPPHYCRAAPSFTDAPKNRYRMGCRVCFRLATAP